MSISQFAFNPPNGWRDHTRFPTYEPDEVQVRDDMQELHDQTRDFINNVVDQLNTDKVSQAVLHPETGAGLKYIRLDTDSNVIETSEDGVDWAATANSGHVILDGNGDAQPQRTRLRFMGSTVTDEDGATVVNGLNVISAATETPLTGVLMGEDGNVKAVPLETTLVSSLNPIAALAVDTAIGNVQELARGKVLSCSVSGVDELPILLNISNPVAPGIPVLNGDNVPIEMVLSNPDAQVDDWEVETGAGSVTISGEIFGETDITLTFVLPYKKTVM